MHLLHLSMWGTGPNGGVQFQIILIEEIFKSFLPTFLSFTSPFLPSPLLILPASYNTGVSWIKLNNHQHAFLRWTLPLRPNRMDRRIAPGVSVSHPLVSFTSHAGRLIKLVAVDVLQQPLRRLQAPQRRRKHKQPGCWQR